MPRYTTEAIVVRTYPLGESDRIVVLLTRDRGKKRGVARGARRSRRRFGGALEPLTRVRAEYLEREHRELVMVYYAEPLESPMTATNPDAPGYAAYFAELLDEWAPLDHPNEKLFRLGAAAVRTLSSGVSMSLLARYFEFWLLRIEGVYPATDRCATCGGPIGSGASVCDGGQALRCLECTPGGVADLSSAALAFIRHASTCAPGTLAGMTLADRAVSELERVHRTLLTRHLDREPRALRVLRQMDVPQDGDPTGRAPAAVDRR